MVSKNQIRALLEGYMQGQRELQEVFGATSAYQPFQVNPTVPGASSPKVTQGMGSGSPYEQPIPGELSFSNPEDEEQKRSERWQTILDILHRSQAAGDYEKKRKVLAKWRKERETSQNPDSPSS